MTTHRKPSNKYPPKRTPTPQNISKIKGSWGGRRPNSGGPREGSGRPQRQPTAWPQDTDLTSELGVDRFLRKFIEESWKNNVLDARMASALNGTVKLLLELRQWCGSGERSCGWNSPVEGEEDQESEAEPDPNKSAVETVNKALTDLQDKTRRELQSHEERCKVLIETAATPPDVKKEAQKILDDIRRKQASNI